VDEKTRVKGCVIIISRGRGSIGIWHLAQLLVVSRGGEDSSRQKKVPAAAD
jgi:hypothetical protein